MIKLTLICPSHLRKISMSSLVSPTLNALVSGASMVSIECLFEVYGSKIGCLMILTWCLCAVMKLGSRSEKVCEDEECCVCLSTI